MPDGSIGTSRRGNRIATAHAAVIRVVHGDVMEPNPFGKRPLKLDQQYQRLGRSGKLEGYRDAS